MRSLFARTEAKATLLVRQAEFSRGGITEGVIAPDVVERTLAAALARGGDFAEVFAEDRHNVTARLDDGRVEELVSGRSRGAGIRVVRGESTGFAHTADLSERGLAAAAEAAAAAARGGSEGRHAV